MAARAPCTQTVTYAPCSAWRFRERRRQDMLGAVALTAYTNLGSQRLMLAVAPTPDPTTAQARRALD